MSKPVCIIPARMGSKRLPRKNVIMCDGKPLLWYTIQAAKDSGVFDEIIVNSDDPMAISIAKEMGVINWQRVNSLGSDTATVVDVVLSVMALGPFFGVLLPTCPLRTAEDIKLSYGRWLVTDCDFVMSVTEYYYHPYQALRFRDEGVIMEDDYLHPRFESYVRMQSQQWEDMYHHNGAIVFGHTESLRKHKSFYGGKVVPYFMSRERSVDIDTIDDLEYAEYLLKKRRGVV